MAHDLDAIRVVLGEPKLHYFGNSYGTIYGQANIEVVRRARRRMYSDVLACGIAHLHEPITVPDLATQAAASDWHLNRRFIASVGTTPLQ